MRRTTVRIDIRTIRCVIDDICLRTKCIEHCLRNRRRCTVCTVESDTQILECTCWECHQITDITVSTHRIIRRPSNLFFRCKWNLRYQSIDIILDLILHSCIHLRTMAVDDLDSVIIKWVMARGDHDSTVKFIGTHNIRHARCRCDMHQIYICATCRQSGN